MRILALVRLSVSFEAVRLPWRTKLSDLHVGDPRFDDWEVLHDFEDLDTARAWRRHLDEAGIEAAITSDWPLDHFRRGDIALRVPPGAWSDAEELLGEPY